jgi:hypothetical protein
VRFEISNGAAVAVRGFRPLPLSVRPSDHAYQTAPWLQSAYVRFPPIPDIKTARLAAEAGYIFCMASSYGLHPGAGGKLLLSLRSRPLKPEVEIDVDGVALASWHRQQPLASAEREITSREWIITEVNLCGQSTIARCFN